jgi:hypothetical protein
VKPAILTSLNRELKRQLATMEEVKRGKPAKVDEEAEAKALAFLKPLTSVEERSKVFVASYRDLKFVLLNCKTEVASKFMEPRKFGTFVCR